MRVTRRVLALLAALAALPGCNPIYVARASWTQIGILRSRVPFEEMIADSTTAPETREKLALVSEARAYAVSDLGFRDIGRSYTSYAQLESDTLAMIVSAAYKDRLEFKTWWFPVIGRVPYRGYFSLEDAEAARDELDREGFDTYLRPTAAFSTLGWFADPLYSTLIRQEEVALVESVLHELAHNHLYVPGQGIFNESFANFVGYTSAIQLFCTTARGGPDSVPCQRARDRWEDAMTISRYLDDLEARVRALYARGASGPGGMVTNGGSTATGETAADFLEERERIFADAQARFSDEVRPTLRISTYSYLATEPLNNATLLSRSLYYRRLPEFQGLWDRFPGDFAGLMAWFRVEAALRSDPFDLLSETPTAAEVHDAVERPDPKEPPKPRRRKGPVWRR